MARGSPLGKGAGTGVKREMKMERMRRLFLLDILILLMARSPERLVLKLRVDSVQWKINHHYNVDTCGHVHDMMYRIRKPKHTLQTMSEFR